jgi:hypothetical protein
MNWGYLSRVSAHRIIHGASAMGELCRQRSQITHNHGVTRLRSVRVATGVLSLRLIKHKIALFAPHEKPQRLVARIAPWGYSLRLCPSFASSRPAVPFVDGRPNFARLHLSRWAKPGPAAIHLWAFDLLIFGRSRW